MALLDKDQLRKFKEALEAIIVSSQGLTYDECKGVAEREATFLISTLLPEPNIQSSNIKETIRAKIERLYKAHSGKHGCDEVGLNLKYLEDVLDTIPEQPEVDCHDLEEEIDDWYNTMGIPVTADALKETARHFYELGLKAKKEESVKVAESPSKTFPRVNEFDRGSSYRR